MADTSKFILLPMKGGKWKLINRQYIRRAEEDEKGELVIQWVCGKSFDFIRADTSIGKLAEALKATTVYKESENG